MLHCWVKSLARALWLGRASSCIPQLHGTRNCALWSGGVTVWTPWSGEDTRYAPHLGRVTGWIMAGWGPRLCLAVRQGHRLSSKFSVSLVMWGHRLYTQQLGRVAGLNPCPNGAVGWAPRLSRLSGQASWPGRTGGYFQLSGRAGNLLPSPGRAVEQAPWLVQPLAGLPNQAPWIVWVTSSVLQMDRPTGWDLSSGTPESRNSIGQDLSYCKPCLPSPLSDP